MTPPGFELDVRVFPGDIDDLDHANNVAYLRWILAAATGHWDAYRAKAPAEAVDGVAWVVIRHEIEYFAAALLGDRLRVVTWVPTCTATTCDRYAEVIRAADGMVLARSASCYCVIDRASGRARRLTEKLRQAIGAPEFAKRVRAQGSFPGRPAVIERA